MKKITLTLAAIVAAFSLQAQTTVFQDNFDDEDVSDWTLYDEDGDTNNWADQFVITDTGGNPVTPVSLISRSWLQTPLTPDNWIVSPAIDLSNYSSAEIDWKVQAAAATWDQEKYTVYVGTSTAIADMVSVFSETYDDPNDAGPQLAKNVDISAFAGQVVHIAFRHHDCTDQDFISIDDVMVTGQPVASVANSNFSGFNYYINSNTELHVSADMAIDAVSIHNVLGQKVNETEINNSNGQVNIASLQNGVYIGQVTIEGQVKSFKFVKK